MGYVVDLICCWSADWLLCHCLSSLFGSSRFLMIYRAAGITFVNIENPEKDIQMTNWMMISKKVKKFNKILVSSSHIISYLFSYLCWYRAHMLLATYSLPILISPPNRIGKAWYERFGGTSVVQDI